VADAISGIPAPLPVFSLLRITKHNSRITAILIANPNRLEIALTPRKQTMATSSNRQLFQGYQTHFFHPSPPCPGPHSTFSHPTVSRQVAPPGFGMSACAPFLYNGLCVRSGGNGKLPDGLGPS
jgi:hypothetical protein